MKRHFWRSALVAALMCGAGLAQGDQSGSGTIYRSISDSSDGLAYPGSLQGGAYESSNGVVSSEAAYQSLTDQTAPIPTTSPVERAVISDLSTPPLNDQVAQVSGLLSGPGCGVAGDPTCGIAGATPITIGPNCGMVGPAWGVAEPSCGVAGCTSCGPLAGSGPSCGLGKLFSGGSGGCDDCGGPKCGALCTRNCPTCCGVGTHGTYVYGEFLYLRPRNADVAYAVAANGPITSAVPIQVAPVGVLDPDFEVGFRAGMNVALDTVSSLDIRYTMFESETEDETSTQAPFVLQSLVNHPSSVSAATDSLSAIANLDINFDLGDVAYRHLLICREVFSLNYVLGARYARLEQEFYSEFLKNGVEEVATDIDFEGAGLRIGLESARFSCRNNLHVYARGYASFVAGRFKSDYSQSLSFDPEVVQTSWEAGRIVPILDLEMGVGWSSDSGKLRLTAGYLVSSWFNTVTTQEFIQSVQGNQYLDLSDSLTFDGLNARVEYRF